MLDDDVLDELDRLDDVLDELEIDDDEEDDDELDRLLDELDELDELLSELEDEDEDDTSLSCRPSKYRLNTKSAPTAEILTRSDEPFVTGKPSSSGWNRK